MAEACINDTNSVDLSFNVSEELEADVRLRGIADGSITETVDGIGVVMHPAGGLQATAAGAGLKLGQGLSVGNEGLMKVNGFASVGSPSPSNATNPNSNILRGANAQIGGSLSIAASLPSNETVSTVAFYGQWRGDWSTNYTELGSGAILDSVYAYLQFQLDAAGWITYDQASLARYNMGGSFALSTTIGVQMANNTPHQMDLRLVVGGGTASATATQGVIRTEYGGFLAVMY